MDLSKLKVLIWGNGDEIEHADRLGRDFGKVWYYTPYQTGYCDFKDYSIGKGFPNVEKVKSFWAYVDQADLICFFNEGQGDLCAYLRKMGKRVYGAGKGEIMENERLTMRKIQKEVGLPAQKTYSIRGVTKLREFLKKNDNVYVKLDEFRKTKETFGSKSYDEKTIRIVDKLALDLGPHREEFPFIIEAEVPAIIECGFDAFFSDGFLSPCTWGVESRVAWVGKFDDNPPSLLKHTMDKLSPKLKEYDYRGSFSTEERWVSKTKSYVNDATCRYPFPLSLILTEAITNYSELIYAVAGNENVKIETKYKYMMGAPMESPNSHDNWIPLLFDHKLKDRIKLNYCTKGEFYEIVPGSDKNIYLISIGNDLKKMYKEIQDLSHEISGDGLTRDGLRGLDECFEDMKHFKELGLNF